MARKKNLAVLLIERQFASTREEARRLIQSGKIRVNGIIRKSIHCQYEEDAQISLCTQKPYVSRGGIKLEGALNEFDIAPDGWICLDIGSSTGGFTDCLLQHGARRVYAVDVGYGILDWKLRTDDRVVVLERSNARNLSSKEVKDWIDLCVIDASFISLNLLLEPVLRFFQQAVRIIALVKPQFQLPYDSVASGGVVKDAHLHEEAVDMVRQYAQTIGLRTVGTVRSPILGAKGNQEFFLLLERC